jgi:hypothetical protein
MRVCDLSCLLHLQGCIARYRKEEYIIEIDSEGSDSGNNALYIRSIFHSSSLFPGFDVEASQRVSILVVQSKLILMKRSQLCLV